MPDNDYGTSTKDSDKDVCTPDGFGENGLVDGLAAFRGDGGFDNQSRENVVGELAIRALASFDTPETQASITNDSPSIRDETSLYAGVELSLSTPLGGFSTPSVGLLRDNNTGDFGLKVCSPSVGAGGAILGFTFGEFSGQSGGVPTDLFSGSVEGKATIEAAFFVGVKGSLGGAIQSGPTTLSGQAEAGIVFGMVLGAEPAKVSACATVNINEALNRANDKINEAAGWLTEGVNQALRRQRF